MRRDSLRHLFLGRLWRNIFLDAQQSIRYLPLGILCCLSLVHRIYAWCCQNRNSESMVQIILSVRMCSTSDRFRKSNSRIREDWLLFTTVVFSQRPHRPHWRELLTQCALFPHSFNLWHQDSGGTTHVIAPVAGVESKTPGMMEVYQLHLMPYAFERFYRGIAL